MRRSILRSVVVLLGLLVLAAACSDSTSTETAGTGAGGSVTTAGTTPAGNTPAAITPDQVAAKDTTGTTVRLVTHDSFVVSDGLFDKFKAQTGITVEVTSAGDAGALTSRAVLTAGQPEADVLYGIDNTFLQRGLNADLFVPYQSPGLAQVPSQLQLDAQHRVTPIDFGDVCVNYWTSSLPAGQAPPATLDDLTKPELAGSFVTEDPETSSPGFAFLLATIAAYGEPGWEAYWQKLHDGGVTVTSGWEEAYSGKFVAGGGDKALVTSYASSPVAEVVYAKDPITTPPTGVVKDGCFRQVEFAGVLNGTKVPEAAAKLVDFMLSDTFQADIPLNMFVSPANETVALPEVYTANTAVPTKSLTLDPAQIEANRSRWTERWAEIVLR